MKIKSITKQLLSPELFLMMTIFFLFTILFWIFPPYAADWHRAFYQVSKTPLSPYDIKLFINPPWTVLILYPFHYFSENISLAMNASLSLVILGLLVIKRKGNLLSLALTLTSFPFLSMLSNGNVEWIPALGFIFQNGWGLPFLLTKPQTGILAILSWISFFSSDKILKRNLGNIIKDFRFFIPTILTVIISFVFWGNWLAPMMTNIQNLQNPEHGMPTWNISLFPWSIPLGLGLLFYIIKHKPVDSEILGVLATLCLVPYFAAYSLTIFFALLSVAHHRIAIALWFLLWLYPVLTHWSFVLQILGIH